MSNDPAQIDIFIADDHPIVRQGLINIIERDERFRVIAQAGTGRKRCAACWRSARKLPCWISACPR